MSLYKLTPVGKDYLWGGTKLRELYGKAGDLTPHAESWELSTHKDGKSTVDGVPLCDLIGKAEIGTNATDFEDFPILIKFIDAKQNLSVQVHPSDEMASIAEGGYGKTEMWYIMDAEEGAGIYLGFKEDVDEDTVRSAIAEERLTDYLNFYPVKPGESYFIPAGTVHAIGAGCLIAEIQQNSNLTYRVYDFGRIGADGKPRELHVEKALKAANFHKFENNSLQIKSKHGDIIGACKYFTTTKLTLTGEKTIEMDEKTFTAIVSLGATGSVGDVPMRPLDTFFITANNSAIALHGKGDILMVQVRKHYVGIDLGGTFIKGGIVNDLGEILLSDKVPTESEKGSEGVASNIASLVNSLLSRANLAASDVVGIGMGVPGMINSKEGIVTYSNNLGWRDFSISKRVEELTSLPVRIANDANVAALGEVKFGGAKGFDTVIMLTLGTGVGGGAVLDGHLFEGNQGAGAEFGHSVIVFDGEPCSCGRKGCLEAYASATALIRDTKRAMEAHPDSKMWEVGSLDVVDGATSFTYAPCDPYAREVVDHYVAMLGTGMCNIANVFRPEAILIGGGVCAQGDNLVKPLDAYVKEHIYAGELGPEVKIVTAKLGNSAGLVGSAALWMD